MRLFPFTLSLQLAYNLSPSHSLVGRSVLRETPPSQEGTSGQDNLYGAAATAAAADGSTILTGRTQGDWDGESEGDFDFMAIKFKDGAEMWRLQVCVCHFFPRACARCAPVLLQVYVCLGSAPYAARGPFRRNQPSSRQTRIERIAGSGWKLYSFFVQRVPSSPRFAIGDLAQPELSRPPTLG